MSPFYLGRRLILRGDRIGIQRMKLTGAAILVSRGMKVLQAAPAAYPYRSPALRSPRPELVPRLATSSWRTGADKGKGGSPLDAWHRQQSNTRNTVPAR